MALFLGPVRPLCFADRSHPLPNFHAPGQSQPTRREQASQAAMSEDTRITKAAPAPNPAESSSGAGASPSKSHGGVFSGLFDLANGTAARLDALWEEVGCSPQERRDHLKGACVT